jgi:hypothetical protein
MLNDSIVITNCQALHDQYVILRRLKAVMDDKTKEIIDSIKSCQLKYIENILYIFDKNIVCLTISDRTFLVL